MLDHVEAVDEVIQPSERRGQEITLAPWCFVDLPSVSKLVVGPPGAVTLPRGRPGPPVRP
jgi:hypothetical protein